MIRLLFKSVVVLLLVFFVGNYLIYLNTGQIPLRDVRERMGDDWFADLGDLFSPDHLAASAKQAVKGITDDYSVGEQAESTKVYKWTDANGQVHFGDKPSADGAEQIEVDTRNSISAPEDSINGGTGQTAPTVDAQKSVHESALDKARAAADAMRQHTRQQEQVQ